MNRNYIFLTILMLVLAGGTWLLNKPAEFKQIKPNDLLWEIIQPTRYITTDQVAKMIIEKDPSLLVVDVRSSDEYDEFTLPNAIHMPLDSIINNSNNMYFGIKGMNVVFISNDDIKADQAWVINKRLGYKSTYVMKGGLNSWYETILNPKRPPETSPATDFELYTFRKGARLYFTGAQIDTSSKQKKDKLIIQRKRKTKITSGGC
ncbi:MAG: rhodanese-like domain-containing protein [Bacteroidales bacterium]|nr:rhodanese-like domain-containing protein [Bacteroidales bacterium]